MHPLEPTATASSPIRTARGDIAICDDGEGPTVLLIHGVPGSARDFRWLVPMIAPTLRCVRIDLPGYGASPRETVASAAVSERVASCRAVLDALQIERAVVIGHSMGGPTAVELALHHADRVRALVLIASPGRVPHRMFRRFRPARLQRILTIPGARHLLMPALRSGFKRAGFSASLTDATLLYATADAAALDFDRHAAHLAELAKRDLPSLVAWATDDRLIETAILDELAELVPTGPRLRFDSGGHNIQKTRATEIGEALATWVATLVTLAPEGASG